MAKVCPQCGEIKSISSFKDGTLITGLGRFCLDCKSQTSSREYVSTSAGRRLKLDSEPSRSDMNKLLGFSGNPEKYATGTNKARAKVEHLEAVKHKFSDGQLATYESAKKKYDIALAEGNQFRLKKTDYVVLLKDAFDNHKSIKIRYKGAWRTIDPYSLNNTYVVAYCHFAHDIRTFRVDRIQGAELSNSFDLNESLKQTAQSRLIEAPNYRGTGRYRRKY